MATVYSLVCWGGLTGKAVSSVTTSNDRLTISLHGLQDGQGVQFTSGTLPTVSGAALALNTTYYGKSISINEFELYYDSALTSKIDLTSTGSSLVLKSAYYQGLSDTSRWGSRIYGSISTWASTRNSLTSGFDVEFCEIGEAFNDIISNSPYIEMANAPAIIVESTINGVFTTAFHNGLKTSGYCYYPGVNLAPGNNATIRGIRVSQTSGGGNVVSSNRNNFTVDKCIIVGGGTKQSVGIQTSNGVGWNFTNNLITNCNWGIQHFSYATLGVFANNTIVGNNYGIKAYNDQTTLLYGKWFNNICFDNSTQNWGPITTQLDAASNNAGASGDTIWYTGSNPTFTVSASDFVNSAGGDYRPSSTSSLIDHGVGFYGVPSRDIKNSERPNYNNGGAEAYDIGAFEYDHGYGPHPATGTINLTNIVDGSRVLITKASDGNVLYNNVPGTSLSFSTSFIGDFNVVVRKASASPFYREFNASGTTVANQTTTIKCLQQLDE